jgi:Rad3-related DNA helicase
MKAMKTETVKIRISVRNIVEFILRSGDIDNRSAGTDPAEAMQAGTRLHRKIQKSMGPEYLAEVPLSILTEYERGDVTFGLTVEGRADGIFAGENGTVIDEIKCVMRDLDHVEKPVPEHRFQVMCYARMVLANREPDAENIGIRLIYCNIETEEKKYFEESFSRKELEDFFDMLCSEYVKWEENRHRWVKKRDESIKSLEFPFEYREGQKKLVTDVYRSILRGKRLFIEAPTGVGKTISTVFPAVKGLGEGLAEKIFYNTSKTTVGGVAKEAFKILAGNGAKLKVVTVTAKEKICILDKPECNPKACPRAKGHYDRVNDAVFDMIVNEESISRELITEYAEKHNVCPFEMCLDVSLWADAIICDYNYVFDPNVRLKRFFVNESTPRFFLLADEAHNLVERARNMYSADLCKPDLLMVKRLVKDLDRGLVRLLDAVNRKMLAMSRECEKCKVLTDIDELAFSLLHLLTRLDKFMRGNREMQGHEEVLRFYFDLRHFMNMFELADENFRFVSDYAEDGAFRVRIMCMDPSAVLNECLESFKAAVFFSATLLPVSYYREQLGGRADDYAVYAPSPFLPENRLVLIGRDVSTKYTRRTDAEYSRIADYIEAFVNAKAGNYLVFFPSYKMLETVGEKLLNRVPGLIMQTPGMNEEEREAFIAGFSDETVNRTGLCVLGGIFGEGIDLKEDRLIGAVIVGTGLPQVCDERELYKDFFDERNGNGFEYSYLYAGMNKVEQAAGRVIRTMSDRGAILLLDERFLQSQYQRLFPREWADHRTVDLAGMQAELKKFWENGDA